MNARTIASCAVLALSGLAACHGAERGNEKIKILGVGNSFTANATRDLPRIIESDETVSADVGLAYIGGCSLDRHAHLARLAEEKPDAKQYCSYRLNGKGIKSGVSLKYAGDRAKSLREAAHEAMARAGALRSTP